MEEEIDTAVIAIEVEETEWLLHPSAGNESCCIFRVPQCFAEIHTKTYQPHIVSIGPYHYGKQHLQMMQQHKRRYLRNLIYRTPPTGPKLDDYMQAVAAKVKDIRRSYSDTVNLCSRNLIEIMVLDGIFIVELICKVAQLISSDPDDPIVNLHWVFPNIIRDLLRLENQIPFFVLQILFEKSKDTRERSESSLSKLALEFISYALERPEEVVNQQFLVEPKHLLDLARVSYIPQPPSQPSHPNASSVQFIQSARKLYLSGIKFKTVEQATSFLEIKFRQGVLEIPKISLDDLRTEVFRNFVAFEQCYSNHCSKHITAYAAFMSCLIRTPADAAFLSEINIIENYLGTDEEVADFFRNLGKDVPFDMDESYLRNLFNDVNEYQNNNWHIRWAGFKFKYFDSPWSFLSALAAVILLLLTILQSFYAVYAYYNPR